MPRIDSISSKHNIIHILVNYSKCHLMSKPVFVYRKEHTMHMYQRIGAGKHVQVYHGVLRCMWI